jgi:hypothetical protein
MVFTSVYTNCFNTATAVKLQELSHLLLVGESGGGTAFLKSIQLKKKCSFTLSFFLALDPTRVMAFSFLRFLDHTQRHTTVGRTPLD